MRRITSGWVRFQTSGGSPNWRPLANSIVPIAPSAMIGSALGEQVAELLAGLAAVDGAARGGVGETVVVDRLEHCRLGRLGRRGTRCLGHVDVGCPCLDDSRRR